MVMAEYVSPSWVSCSTFAVCGFHHFALIRYIYMVRTAKSPMTKDAKGVLVCAPDAMLASYVNACIMLLYCVYITRLLFYNGRACLDYTQHRGTNSLLCPWILCILKMIWTYVIDCMHDNFAIAGRFSPSYG